MRASGSVFFNLSSLIRRLACWWITCVGLFLGPEPLLAQTTPFQADGFSGPHPITSAAPDEHVDPLSGNVLIAATDLVLPGNAGLDLTVQRFYSSQIFPDYENGSSMALEDDQWAGLGWRLHFGRVLHTELTGAGQTIVDLPGGGGGPLYHSAAYPEGWITKGFARYNRSTNTLLLPNGLIYTFGQVTTSTRGGTVRYVTQIQDQYGNKIVFTYFTAPGPTDGVQDIKQYLTLDGTEFREVTFTYDAATNGLASMTYNGRTWTYTQTAFGGSGRSLLQQVQPPAGPATQYAYDGVTGELTQITAASGGTVGYTYGAVTHYASTITIPDRVVTQRIIGGRGVTAGTWTFAYSQGSNKDQTVVTCPCGTTKYAYVGTGLSGDFSAATRGALTDLQIYSPSGTLLEQHSMGWIKSDAISTDSIPATNGLWGDPDVRAAIPSVHTTIRNGQYWLTTYGYSGANYNDYLNPNQINENGERIRTTTLTYRTGLTPHILGRLASRTVTVGSESATSSWTYDTASGFQTQATVLGVATSYTKSAVGNVATVTDARGNVTTYQYDWGVPISIQGPQLTQTRTVNQDGTLATATLGGLTTTYLYDTAGRLTTIKPPGYASGPSTGWQTYSYDSLGTWYRAALDTSQTQYNLDGFGRVSSTVNQVGLKTSTTRDACGRVTFQSLPYTTGAPRGVTTAFDALNRAISVTAPNGSVTTITYSTNDQAVTDPLNRQTSYAYAGAGTPDGVLASVTDSNATTTTYGYNVNDTLVSVALPGVPTRTWAYDSHNWLTSDTQPESGTTTYGRDAMGHVTQITKANGEVTTLTYDASNRLIGRDAPGTDSDATITYDAAGRVSQKTTPAQTTTYGYDAKGRLASRQDTRGTLSWTSSYQYDDRGNLTQITYPSGRVIAYTYDAENRLTGATQNGTSFASSFVYDDSGRLTSYNTGPVAHTMAYDTADRVQHLTAGAGGLDLTYSYNAASEVTGIADPRPGMSQSFIYDPLSRLIAANGPWGRLDWTYDAAGNRLTQNFGAMTNYTYASATQRLTGTTGANPESFAYNANGQLTGDSRGAYSYNGAGLLATATSTAVAAGYGYDADDQRIAHTVNGVTGYTVRGSGGETLSEYQQACGATLWTRDLLYAGGQLVGAVKATLTQPTVAFVSSAVSVNESAGNATVTVQLTTPGGVALACPVTVSYATAPGTAQPALDYTTTAGTLQFAAGAVSGSTQTITVPLVNDALDEDDETFSVALSTITGGGLSGPASAIVTILDNDPTPTLTMADISVVEGNSGSTPGALTAVLSAVSGRTVSLNYATVNGTATAGSDYTAKSGTLTFDPGVTSLPLSVSVLGDTAQEQDETFTIGLSAAQNVTLPGTSPTVTILDDDRLQVTLSANKSFPLAAGQTVTWTATATRGTAPYTYKFWIYHGGLATWRIVQAYTSTATLTWTPFEPGSYQVRVWARNNESVTAYDAEAVSSTVTITAAPAVSVTALSANKTFPMDSAVTATWTATASGGVGPLQYKFTATNASSSTTTICDYNPSASCAWVPLRPSTYTVQVYVRSAGSTAAYDGTLSQAGITVTGGGTTPISLTSSVPFPAAVNSPVTWTAVIASGSNPLLYQFNWRPTSTQTWTTGQAYSSSPTWTWTPNATGTYVVQVWGKETTFPGQFETYITTGTLTVSSGAVSSVSLTMSENFPLTTQTPITFTAGATGGTAALQYQFQLWDAQTSAWTVVQDYSAVRTWTWTPPRAGYGCYAVLVLVKSTGAPSWEASTQTGYLAVTP